MTLPATAIPAGDGPSRLPVGQVAEDDRTGRRVDGLDTGIRRAEATRQLPRRVEKVAVAERSIGWSLPATGARRARRGVVRVRRAAELISARLGDTDVHGAVPDTGRGDTRRRGQSALRRCRVGPQRCAGPGRAAAVARAGAVERRNRDRVGRVVLRRHVDVAVRDDRRRGHAVDGRGVEQLQARHVRARNFRVRHVERRSLQIGADERPIARAAGERERRDQQEQFAPHEPLPRRVTIRGLCAAAHCAGGVTDRQASRPTPGRARRSRTRRAGCATTRHCLRARQAGCGRATVPGSAR